MDSIKLEEYKKSNLQVSCELLSIIDNQLGYKNISKKLPNKVLLNLDDRLELLNYIVGYISINRDEIHHNLSGAVVSNLLLEDNSLELAILENYVRLNVEYGLDIITETMYDIPNIMRSGVSKLFNKPLVDITERIYRPAELMTGSGLFDSIKNAAKGVSSYVKRKVSRYTNTIIVGGVVGAIGVAGSFYLGEMLTPSAYSTIHDILYKMFKETVTIQREVVIPVQGAASAISETLGNGFIASSWNALKGLFSGSTAVAPAAANIVNEMTTKTVLVSENITQLNFGIFAKILSYIPFLSNIPSVISPEDLVNIIPYIQMGVTGISAATLTPPLIILAVMIYKYLNRSREVITETSDMIEDLNEDALISLHAELKKRLVDEALQEDIRKEAQQFIEAANDFGNNMRQVRETTTAIEYSAPVRTRAVSPSRRMRAIGGPSQPVDTSAANMLLNLRKAPSEEEDVANMLLSLGRRGGYKRRSNRRKSSRKEKQVEKPMRKYYRRSSKKRSPKRR